MIKSRFGFLWVKWLVYGFLICLLAGLSGCYVHERERYRGEPRYEERNHEYRDGRERRDRHEEEEEREREHERY